MQKASPMARLVLQWARHHTPLPPAACSACRVHHAGGWDTAQRAEGGKWGQRWRVLGL